MVFVMSYAALGAMKLGSPPNVTWVHGHLKATVCPLGPCVQYIAYRPWVAYHLARSMATRRALGP